MDVRDFILARLADRERAIRFRSDAMARELSRDSQAIRDILDLHNKWVIALETPVKFEPEIRADELKEMTYPDNIHFTASREILFVTEQQYRVRFQKEPPTAPMIRAIAAIWNDHQDYEEEWG